MQAPNSEVQKRKRSVRKLLGTGSDPSPSALQRKEMFFREKNLKEQNYDVDPPALQRKLMIFR